MLYLHTLLLPLGKFLEYILTSFWQLFAGFCLNWLVKTLELSGAKTGLILNCQTHHCIFTLLGFSKALACQCLKLAVVAVWIAMWSGSHQKLLKRCQNFLRYISNGEVHTCNKCCKTKVAHNLIGLPSLFYKRFVHKSCTYTCIMAVLLKSTVSVLL